MSYRAQLYTTWPEKVEYYPPVEYYQTVTKYKISADKHNYKKNHKAMIINKMATLKIGKGF